MHVKLMSVTLVQYNISDITPQPAYVYIQSLRGIPELAGKKYLQITTRKVRANHIYSRIAQHQ